MADGETHAPALDRAAMRAWLLGDDVVDAHGRVFAWQHGHAYPEAGGLWLSWAADEPAAAARAPAVAAWLDHCIDTDAVGRDAVRYLFDLAVVLLGRMRFAHSRGASWSPSMQRGCAQLLDALARGVACWPEAGAPRWSRAFASHLRKLALLSRWLPAPHGARVRELLLRRIGATEAVPPRPSAHADATYLHAFLYALEGQWALLGPGSCAAAATWLTAAQREDGGVCAWWSVEGGGRGPARADATAQAIRLWAAVDREAHAPAIARGLGFLARQLEGGAVRYDDTSAHRNVWCTLFAVQAQDFAHAGARVEALL